MVLVAMKRIAVVLAWTSLLGAEAQEPDHIVDPEELRNLTIPPPRSYDDWADWETWEASPEVAKLIPYYRSGYDYDGLVEFGKVSYRVEAQLPEDQEEEFWKLYEQINRWVERDAALCNGQGAVHLLDWDGFSLKNYGSVGALKESLKMFASFVRISNSIKYGFIINVNFAAENFIQISRPFMGTLLDKYEIYGTRAGKWKPMLLRRIPASQLPPKYGGNEDWKPLALN